MEKLKFEIATRPLLYSNIENEVTEDDNFKLIIRDDDSSVLSVMKKTYEPLFNREFESLAEEMAKISGFELLNFKEFKEGRIVLANLKTSGSNTLFGKKIDNYMILGSSHDGSYPWFIGTAIVNLWCQNQFSKIHKITKVRHTSGAEEKRKSLMSDLEVYFKQKELMYEDFHKFQKVEVPEELRRESLLRVLGMKREDILAGKISSRKLNQFELLQSAYMVEAAEYGHTVYAMFNAATRYTTHSLKSKDLVFGNFHGVPGWFNENAYKVANELVEISKI